MSRFLAHGILGILVLVAHVAAGFVGMYGGLVPMFARKGGAGHRRWGRVFTYAMATASVTAFPLAYWRRDPFQAAVGLLAGYGAFLGRRIVRRDREAFRPASVDTLFAWIAVVGFALLTMSGTWRESHGSGDSSLAAIVFGASGLLLAARDLHGSYRREFSPRRRVVDHVLATSLTLVVAWSSFLNTQLWRLTGLHWSTDAKMLLPFAVTLPLLAYWLPKWDSRLVSQGAGAWAAGREPSEIERLRGFGIAEGVSFLVLVGIAVPLERIGGYPAFVKVMGPVHGAMFVLYTTTVLLAARSLGWRWKRVLVALAAGIVPFGTFVLDARLKRESLSGAPGAAEHSGSD